MGVNPSQAKTPDLKTVLHICYTSVTHRKPTHMCNRFARPKGQLSMLTL